MRRLAAACLVVTTALAGAAFGAPNAPKEPDPILVGLAGPMSGHFATMGEQMKRGAQRAIDDINAKGGVLGRKLKLVVGDDGCDPQQASTVAGQFAQQKTVLVVGHFCSSASIAASVVYAQAGIMQITPASGDPKLTEDAASKGWTNIFSIAGRADAQGAVAGEYLASKYKGKKVAILDDRSPYGKGLAAETRKSMNKKGLKEVFFEEISQGDTDFSPLIARLKQAGVVAVYFGGYQAEAALLVRQAQGQGLGAQFVAGDALVTDEFWKASGPAGEGVLMTFRPDPRNLPAAQDVVEEFRQQDYDPAGYTLFSYAALQVFADAAGQAKSLKFAELVRALHAHKYNTVVGPIAFDKKGDVLNPDYALYVWHDGKYAEQKKGS
jgi:branched-chain amino acid transport system substrate-binding protein